MSPGRRLNSRVDVRSGPLAGRGSYAFARPPWETYLYVLNQLACGQAPVGADKVIAEVEFVVSCGTTESTTHTLTTFADWIQSRVPGGRRSLEEMCELMCDMVERHYLHWDSIGHHVVLTPPVD